MSSISTFLKYQRKKNKLTKETIALKAGVGIRFIRDIEQGKELLQLDKVEQVMRMFGFTMIPVKQKIDPY